MHAVVEFIIGLVAMLAAVTLAQFGVEMNRRHVEREVVRISDCSPAQVTDAETPKPIDC